MKYAIHKLHWANDRPWCIVRVDHSEVLDVAYFETQAEALRAVQGRFATAAHLAEIQQAAADFAKVTDIPPGVYIPPSFWYGSAS